MGTPSSTSGKRASVPRESTPLPVGLRRLFLAHAVVSLALGVSLLLVPETVATLVGWGEPFEPVVGHIAGGLSLGLAAGQGPAFRAETWREVRSLFVAVLTEVGPLFAVLLADALAGSAVEDWVLVALDGVSLVPCLYYARGLLGEASYALT